MSGYARIGEELSGQPLHRGLFDPAVEHDACGVAFVARIAGGPAHSVVEQGVQALVNLGHRGASGAEPDSGDGAGILIQVPDAFLREATGLPLPAPGSYGVGMAMLPQDPDERALCEEITLRACRAEGLRLLGWRDVPVVADAVGRSARRALPVPSSALRRRNRPRRVGARGTPSGPSACHRARCAGSGHRPPSNALGELLEPHRRLQGNAHRGAACGLLPGPRRRARDLGAGTRARALLDERASALGSGAAVPACRRTTARSTRCAATSTGCAPVSRGFAARISAMTSRSSCPCSMRPDRTPRNSTTRSSCLRCPVARSTTR